jgi:hypothetical protein
MASTFGDSRELRTIVEIAAILAREDLSIPQILQAVAETLPHGFKYEEVCQARIHFWGECFETRGFTPGPWTLRAPIPVRGDTLGEVEVVYLENRSSRAPASPFHLDQKKLVDLTAQKLGHLAEERLARRDGGPRPPPPAPERKPEWRAILDLLGDIDPPMHHRLIRRLMNHATKLGVPGVQKMIARLDPALYAQGEASTHGSNAPLPKQDLETLRKTFVDI